MMDVVEQLGELLIVLVAAKVGAEAMARLRQPAVIGELLIGLVVGVGALGWVSVGNGGFLDTFAEIGVIVLLYQVGLEIQLTDFAKLGGTATFVAAIGVAVPFALGVVVVKLLGIGSGSTEVAVFVGAAMTATSVGVTARVFNDLGHLHTDEAKTVVGAAVVDDILGLVILAAVAAGLTGDETMTALSMLSLIGRVVLFLALTVALGRLAIPKMLQLLVKLRVPGSYVVGVLVLALAIGIAAALLAGLQPIVGAFVAGLIVAPADQIERIQKEIRPIAHLFVPIFFLAVGARVDLSVLVQPSVIGAGLVITAVAVVGKLASVLGTIGKQVRRSVIGVGMVPRGEVGLIFAALGAGQLSSVVSAEVVAIIVLMVILTTLVPPILLGRLLGPKPPAGGGATIPNS